MNGSVLKDISCQFLRFICNVKENRDKLESTGILIQDLNKMNMFKRIRFDYPVSFLLISHLQLKQEILKYSYHASYHVFIIKRRTHYFTP